MRPFSLASLRTPLSQLSLPQPSQRLATPLLQRHAGSSSFHTSARAMSLEASMRSKLSSALAPQSLTIRNDSRKHAHHAAMVSARHAADGAADPAAAHERLLETHFYVEVVSEQFDGLGSLKRHRLVNALMKEEFDKGLHALSLRLKTPQEVEKEQEQQQKQ